MALASSTAQLSATPTQHLVYLYKYAANTGSTQLLVALVLLEFASRPLRVVDIINVLKRRGIEVSYFAVASALRKLWAKGIAEKIGRGVYRLRPEFANPLKLVNAIDINRARGGRARWEKRSNTSTRGAGKIGKHRFSDEVFVKFSVANIVRHVEALIRRNKIYEALANLVYIGAGARLDDIVVELFVDSTGVPGMLIYETKTKRYRLVYLWDWLWIRILEWEAIRQWYENLVVEHTVEHECYATQKILGLTLMYSWCLQDYQRRLLLDAWRREAEFWNLQRLNDGRRIYLLYQHRYTMEIDARVLPSVERIIRGVHIDPENCGFYIT